MKKDTAFVIVLALITFFACNTDLPTDIMESRNIVTAREIVSDGTWLVPTMNGELRLEKPPLPTWVAGVVEMICPDSLAAQRAAAGLMGVLWTVFFYLFARLLSHRRQFAIIAVVVFLTSYHVVMMGRTATWDIYCHAFMMCAIYLLARGLIAEPRYQWRWLPAAGLMMGLSFLSKGPVSFYALLLPALIASIALPRPTVRGKWAGLLVMALICVIVSGWWYVWLLVYHHDAVTAVINKESGAWSNHNVRPWYYYWRFFAETGIWAVLTLASLAISYWKRALKDSRTYLFSVTWMLAALILLSLMPEKKIRYLLPMMPPCALCVACLLEHFNGATDRVSRWLMRIDGYLTALIALALPIVALRMKWVSTFVGVILCFLFFLLAFYIARGTSRMKSKRLVYGVGVMFMLIELFLLKPIGGVFGNPDRRSISLTQQMTELRGVPFYHAEDDPIRIELVYEAHRKILPADMKDSAQVARMLPFALVSHAYAAQVLPRELIGKVDTVSLGTFDDNRHPRSDRHYTQDFVYHITLIKPKK